MTEKSKYRKNFSSQMLTFIGAVIISDVIKSVSGFNYNFYTEGLDFRILINILIFAVPYFIFDFIFSKIFFKTDK